ncbi:MAG: hypothetical protein JNN15_13410 [Blastocatellia bacterium]|nr:hypothetical protein [Blastocatellia bacterium]
MITRKAIAHKLQERLERRTTALDLTHWAKGLMYDYFQGLKGCELDARKLIEKAVLRISNSSTNYRTFLFDTEIIKLLEQLGHPHNREYVSLYSFNLIVGDRPDQALNIVKNEVDSGHLLDSRQQRSSILITAEGLNEAEIHKVANALREHTFVMSLRDTSKDIIKDSN